MAPPRICPDEPSWRRLLNDAVEEHERDALEAHLDNCESCREQLALLAEWPSAMVASMGDTSSRTFLGRIGLHGPAPEGAETVAARAPELPGFDELLEVGRGGMGVVYRARQVTLDRPVAIKVLSAAGRLAAGAPSRATREARALARLDHPNIVRVHEVGEADDLPYIVMEWVEGGDLAGRLADGPTPPREAATLARALALAVATAHERGIIHRDIKPRNVLLAADGSPRLTDFGLARDLDSAERLTATGLALGTPGYMAPEQVDSSLGPVGTGADVYALGATLYAMLTGRPPFQAASEGELLRQLVEREPVAPRRLNDAIPRDLNTICRKCLEKRQGRRYESAGALAADLGRFLDGRPIHARPIGAIGTILRRARRDPMPAALSLLVIALVVSLVLGSLYFGREQARLRGVAEAKSRLAGEREAEARASADQARRRMRSLSEGMDATSRIILALEQSTHPELQQLYTQYLAHATSIYDGYFRDRHPQADWGVNEARMLDLLAEFRKRQGRDGEATRVRREFVEVGTSLLERDPRDIKLRGLLIGAESTLGVERSEADGPDAAIADFERAHRFAQGIMPGDVVQSYDHYVRSMATANLARTYVRLERYDEAAATHLDGLEFAREVRARRPDDAVVAAMMIEHLTGLAAALIDLARPEEAAPLLDEADAILATLADAGPTSPAPDVSALRDQIREVRDRLPGGPGAR